MAEEVSIRARITYKRFEAIAEAFAESTEKGLRTMYESMDGMKAFHSQTGSNYARESLEQLIKDIHHGN
jgi:hypothetical protein